LHVSYGQRTEERERQAFEDLADHYAVKRRLAVSIEHLAQIGGSSLTDKAIQVTTADLSAQGSCQLRIFSQCTLAFDSYQLAEVIVPNPFISAQWPRTLPAILIVGRNFMRPFNKPSVLNQA